VRRAHHLRRQGIAGNREKFPSPEFTSQVSPHKSRWIDETRKNPGVNAGGNIAMHFAAGFAMLTGLRRLAAPKGRSRSRGKYPQTPVRNATVHRGWENIFFPDL